MKLPVFAIALFVCWTASIAWAQVAVGVPPFASTTGGADVINAGDLNINLCLPVFTKPGRSIPLHYQLCFDNSIWFPAGVSGTQNWQSLANFGWKGSSDMATGGISAISSTTHSCIDPNTGRRASYLISTIKGFRDGFGVVHPAVAVWVPSNVCGDPSGGTPGGTTDGSAYTITPTGSSTAQIQDASGRQVPKITTGIGFGSGTLIDSNGNEVVASNGTYTDTLGLTGLSASGGAPNNLVFSYTDSSGTVRSVTVVYASKTVQTNFGCTGISEYGPSTQSLVSSISYPDGSSVSFTYEPTPGAPGSVTGRLASVTLRTGGVISYSYSGGNNGIVCADGSAATLTRTTPDGTWTYARSSLGGTEWQTAITSPAGDSTSVIFQQVAANFYETFRQIKQGASTTLRTIYTCYNGAFPDCSGAAISLPISERTVYTLLDNGLENKVDTFYNGSFGGSGLVSEVDEYEFGSPSPGGLLRKTLTSYASLGNNILNRVSSVTVQDGSGNQIANTTYAYDEVAITATSGVPAHASISGSRGNLTSVHQWLNTSGSTLNSSMTYDDTGNVLSATDPGGHITSFSYTDNFSDGVNRNTLAYLTTLTLPQTHSPNTASHTTSCKYDVNIGQHTDCTDENGNHSTYAYEAMLRPSQVSYPDGGKTVYTYSGTSQVWTWKYLDSTNHTDFRQHIDGMGRADRTAYLNYQGSWDLQDTCFDNDGRIGFVSYTYQNAAGWNNPSICSGAGDSYSYDGMDRPTRLTHSDGSFLSYSYKGRATQVQDEGNGSYNVTRVTQADGLGRVASVCEISASTLLGSGSTPASCGLDIAGTGFLTSYGHDLLNDLTHVDQGGFATRSYGYDSLSRMTSESFPEQFGCTTSYGYDNDNLLISRGRPAPNQGSCSTTVITTYAYDELHRLRTRSYSDGTTPTATLNYDESNTWGVSTSNAIGRLTSGGISNAAQIFPGADAMGRILNSFQCTPRTCGSGSYNHIYSYDYLGDVTSFNDAGLYILTKNYNSAARLIAVTSSLADLQHPSTIVNNIVYGAFGVSSDSLGNGISESFGYNARGALNSYSAGTAYSFSLGFASDSNISSANDSVNGNWTYGYDQFNRLGSASKTGVSLTWAYDRFGNRWQQNGTGGGNPQYVMDANNHIAGSGVTYDALGNVLNDGIGHSFTYDAESRLINANGTAYTYDAFGRRVKNGSYEFLYDLNGSAVALLDATTGSWAYGEIYAGGRHLATYSGGTTNFLHTDWLGTKRAMTSVSGTQSLTCTGLPFGESSSCATSWTFDGFTDDFHDSESNTEHTLFRQLSTTEGRWLSPDPAGVQAVKLRNPQTLNRYSYVDNFPTNATDPRGTDPRLLAPMIVAAIGGTGGGGCALGGISTPCGLVSSAIGGGAATQCTGNICDRNGPDGRPQEFRAFANSSGYFNFSGPGSVFYTQKSAGLAAVNFFAQSARGGNREYGGNIYSDASGVFSFNLTNIGLVCSSPDVDCGYHPQPDFIPPDTTLTADWHNHPGDGSDWWNAGESFSSYDTDYADYLKIDSYLGTPAGRITVYDPLNPLAQLPVLQGPPWR